MAYAENTSVSVERSRMELERTLARYGASSHGYVSEPTCAMVMFHMWVGHDNNAFGAKYVGEGDGKIGPFPGIVIGGVNGSMKRMVEVLDWRQNPWEFTEPDIAYQASVLQLLNIFIWPQ